MKINNGLVFCSIVDYRLFYDITCIENIGCNDPVISFEEFSEIVSDKRKCKVMDMIKLDTNIMHTGCSESLADILGGRPSPLNISADTVLLQLIALGYNPIDRWLYPSQSITGAKGDNTIAVTELSNTHTCMIENIDLDQLNPKDTIIIWGYLNEVASSELPRILLNSDLISYISFASPCIAIVTDDDQTRCFIYVNKSLMEYRNNRELFVAYKIQLKRYDLFH